jgi:hypothetical protein
MVASIQLGTPEQWWLVQLEHLNSGSLNTVRAAHMYSGSLVIIDGSWNLCTAVASIELGTSSVQTETPLAHMGPLVQLGTSWQRCLQYS